MQKEKKANWVWFNGKVEQMLKFIWEYKLTCDFQGINFEPDLQSLYTKVHNREESDKLIKDPDFLQEVKQVLVTTLNWDYL